jgi:spoIIIJ-associated protein
MDEKSRETIKETVVKLLDVMGLDVAVEDERIENIGGEEEIFSINLSTENPSLLIGQYGANLQCFQHLVNIIVKRKAANYKNDGDNGEIRFNIDVNNYKKQKRDSLVKLAETMADQVIYSKNSVALRPMSSYERKIIHMEMADRKNLTTESVGESLTRRVVIRYVEE